MQDTSYFKMLADNSPLFIGMCDLYYKPFYVNDAGRELVGLNDWISHEFQLQNISFPKTRILSSIIFSRA